MNAENLKKYIERERERERLLHLPFLSYTTNQNLKISLLFFTNFIIYVKNITIYRSSLLTRRYTMMCRILHQPREFSEKREREKVDFSKLPSYKDLQKDDLLCVKTSLSIESKTFSHDRKRYPIR